MCTLNDTPIVLQSNSILHGPSSVVESTFGTISPNYSLDKPNSAALACAKAHNLAFKTGGKVIDNLVSTDAPGVGALFRWSLGDPFMKLNLVAFHYGNLTHPSQDLPRIGILSQVPAMGRSHCLELHQQPQDVDQVERRRTRDGDLGSLARRTGWLSAHLLSGFHLWYV
ncbi:hypothetical protein B0H14DRAFT_2628360 [Mycena olivaceomarginata]|nr:hypothetical protein B0H14DRAFT_2628360 [Mycena olivaceomarginata]